MTGVSPESYFLKSARLGFRCWTKEDLPLARELWADIEVTRFFGGPFSEEEVRKRLEREIARMDAHQFQYWPMHLLADNEYVGCCGLRPYRSQDGIPELGFHLRPKYWGRGLAVEAARASTLAPRCSYPWDSAVDAILTANLRPIHTAPRACRPSEPRECFSVWSR